MKAKFFNKLALLTAFGGLILAPLAVFAQDTLSQEEGDLVARIVEAETVQLEDLGIEKPGILQTNPFYFMKNLRWSTKRVFKFSTLQKAELELDSLNEKAAELKRLEEIIQDSESLLKTLNSYQDNLVRLQTFLNSLNEKSSRPSVDKLLSRLLDLGLKHIKLFDEFKVKSDTRLKEKLEFLQEKISEVIAEALVDLDVSDKLPKRIDRVLDSQRGSSFRGLRLAEVLGRLEEKAPYGSLLRSVLLGAEENLILNSQASIELEELAAVMPTVLEQLSGDRWRRIKFIDEAREFVTSNALKNDLSLVRQLLLDFAAKAREISKPEAEGLVVEAGQLIQTVPSNLLLARAEFNLSEAERLLRTGQYVQSFGQASVAAAAAKNALRQLALQDSSSFQDELNGLKKAYDQLIDIANQNKLTVEITPEFYELMSQAEKAIAEISDLANEKAKLDVIVGEFREAKALLFKSEQLLKNLLQRIQKKIQEKRAAQPLIERVLLGGEKEKKIKEEIIEELKNVF